MGHARGKARVGGGSGGAGYAVIVVSKYWPPPKLVKDLAMYRFGVTRVDLHVVEPPACGDYVRWESVLKEVESLYYLHEGEVAIAVIPTGIELGFIIALREACELLGSRLFLAVVVEESELKGRRRARSRFFGPKHCRYVYLGLSREWVVAVMPLDIDPEPLPDPK